MSLIQISEPSAADEVKVKRRNGIGIDLGTTNSLVAIVKDGQVQVLNDDEGRSQLPSVVHYKKDQAPLVGFGAQDFSVSNPNDTIVSVKRHMGRRPDETDTAATAIQCDESGLARFEVAGGARTAVEVSADILKALRARAECYLNDGDAGDETIDGAVVTVPAYFDDAQRQATRDAAQLAGLKVLRLLNEPTAAAIAYGLDETGKEKETVVVYDLGGGTFDISVLSLDRGIFQVLATGGDSALGGDDFDRLIAERLASDAGIKDKDPQVWRQLINEAEHIKNVLSENETIKRTITLPTGETWEQEFTRAELEELIAPLVDKTIALCRDALHDAQITNAQADEIILVGGTTRIPLIRQRVAELFGKPPKTDLDPDTIVSIGAAIQADILAGNRPDGENLLLDVIPLSLGIETMGGLVERVIVRNTTIPCASARTYTTQKDGQTGISIHVVQGERELVDDCRSLARFELKGIPPMVAGAARINVVFRVDADGLLEVEAREETSGQTARVEIKPSYGLSGDALETMLRTAMDNAEEDVAARVLREAQVEAQRVVDALDSALQADGHLIDDAERKKITTQQDKLNDALSSGNADTINRAVGALEKASEQFIATRMNNSIASVLQGRALNEIESDEVESAKVKSTK